MPEPAATEPIALPEAVRRLVAAHRELVSVYGGTTLRFTLDGRLLGDIAEAAAAEAFDLELCSRRMPGVDAHARDGRSVQVKCSAIGKGPAFSPSEGRADHLIFMSIDLGRCEANVHYNGPEDLVRAKLPSEFAGTKRVSLPQVRLLDAMVDASRRLVRTR